MFFSLLLLCDGRPIELDCNSNVTNSLSLSLLVNEEEAPSGMLARGHYNAVSTFVDDDDTTHLLFEWSFDIAKDW